MITQLDYSEEGAYDVSDLFNIEDCRVVVSDSGQVVFESPDFDIPYSDYEDFLMCFTNTGEGYQYKGNDDGTVITLDITYESYEALEAILE